MLQTIKKAKDSKEKPEVTARRPACKASLNQRRSRSTRFRTKMLSTIFRTRSIAPRKIQKETQKEHQKQQKQQMKQKHQRQWAEGTDGAESTVGFFLNKQQPVVVAEKKEEKEEHQQHTKEKLAELAE